MGLIVWLILSLGAFEAVYGSKCIPETAGCSPYWVEIEPHRNLMESEGELDSWCRKQSLFFRCLEDVLLVIYGNYSKFPTNMLVSKMFTEDLCLEGSTNRKRYLDNAACINRLDLEYCALPEFLEIVTPDGSVPTKCSLADKTFSCIAASMVMRCGFDAGRVYRYLSKVTKYGEEVCGVQSSEGATCKELPDSELSEVYYGLLHRFGRIPEQAEADSLDDQESIFLPEESTISGVMKNALDNMEDSSEGSVSSARSTSDYNEVIRNTDEFRKRPIITEPFKGLLFYNYSNEDFAFYWRQPGSFPISRVTCDHLINNSYKKAVIFECTLHYGYEEPECVKGIEEEITPELIRDIDLTIPKDGILITSKSPDWTGDLRDYKRHRMSWEFFFNAKLVTEDKDIWEVNKMYVLEYPNPELCIKELRFFDIINDKYMDWWQCPSLFSDELRNEILTFLFQNRTRDTDFFFLNAVNWNDTNGKDVTHIHLFEPIFHSFERVVCERVNECHPRGRGVIKCSLERRGIEACDACCVQYPIFAQLCPTKENLLMAAEYERKYSEDLNSSGEGSGNLEESLTEAATFMVNDEATTSPNETINFVTGITGESGDVIAVDLSELPDDSGNDFSSDASLMFLRLNSNDRTENSFVAQSEATQSFSEEKILLSTIWTRI